MLFLKTKIFTAARYYAVTLGIGLCVLIGSTLAYAQTAPTQTPTGGTIPPFQSTFKKSVTPSGPVSPGTTLNYRITITKPEKPAYAATIGLTDTLPAALTLLPETIQATSGTEKVSINGETLTWQGHITPTQQITITYRAQVSNGAPEGALVNSATLYEIHHDSVPTPTTRIVTSTASVMVKTHWAAYLPLIQKPPLDPLPQFDNGDFEKGPGHGWAEKPGKLIYSITESPLAMPAGSQWYAWLGGTPGETNTLTQIITLPAGYTHIQLQFHYWIASQETDCTKDKAEVWINNDLLHTPELKLCGNTNPDKLPTGWRTELVDLTKYVGQPIIVSFRSILDATNNSNFLIDNVELCSNDSHQPDPKHTCP